MFERNTYTWIKFTTILISCFKYYSSWIFFHTINKLEYRIYRTILPVGIFIKTSKLNNILEIFSLKSVLNTIKTVINMYINFWALFKIIIIFTQVGIYKIYTQYNLQRANISSYKYIAGKKNTHVSFYSTEKIHLLVPKQKEFTVVHIL